MIRASLLVLALMTAPAIADPTEVGAWFGPRIFSSQSALGYIDGAPAHPALANSIEFGVRIAHQFIFPWLFPEIEFGAVPTHTNPTNPMSIEANVAWLEPRAQLRFEILPGRRVQPFIVVGVGAPIDLSSARKTINSGVEGDVYGGGGLRFDTRKGFTLRFDARVAVIPGANPPLYVPEVELGFGVELALGVPHVQSTTEVVPKVAPDRDGDGIPDAIDKCPDRPEDFDGFEDADGCPDIDNDGDHILDIADKCPNEPETYNGFEDEDGCPDTVPADVAELHGTIEGLIYAEGETVVHDSALGSIKKIAKIMTDHPGVRIVLIGHTDDREAKAFVTPPTPGQPPADVDSIATELAHGRAEAVRQALVAVGIAQGRIVVDGVGAEEPVADNATAKGRLANRRVEIKLFIAHP